MKVLVVEDHAIVFSGCRALFSDDANVELIEARNVAVGLQLFHSVRPEVIVVDINLPDGSGLDLLRDLLAQDAGARIIVFSMSDAPMLALQAVEFGAAGYVSKNGDPDALRDAVYAVAAGKRWLPEDLLQELALVRAGASEAPCLSEREQQVLSALARGRSMAEIAEEIGVSYKTVAAHSATIRSKLNARTSSEMVRIAVEMRLV